MTHRRLERAPHQGLAAQAAAQLTLSQHTTLIRSRQRTKRATVTRRSKVLGTGGPDRTRTHEACLSTNGKGGVGDTVNCPGGLASRCTGRTPVAHTQDSDLCQPGRCWVGAKAIHSVPARTYSGSRDSCRDASDGRGGDTSLSVSRQALGPSPAGRPFDHAGCGASGRRPRGVLVPGTSRSCPGPATRR